MMVIIPLTPPYAVTVYTGERVRQGSSVRNIGTKTRLFTWAGPLTFLGGTLTCPIPFSCVRGMSVAAVETYLQISECGIVAAAALLTFDYCLTFGQEVEWLYGTRWTAARIHFVCSRYLPFVAIAMAIPTSRVEPPSETSYCGPLGMTTNVMYFLCIGLAESMLIVRTYAFWKRNRKILIGMCTFGGVCGIAAIVTSETSTSSQPTGSIYNCIGAEASVATAIQFICLIVYEMGMLCLNCIAFWRMKQQSPPGRLVMTLYRDGVMYVAAILVHSITNAVVTLAAPVQYSDILNSPQMVAHSILASRIFFNLRETTRREQSYALPIPLTEFRATSGGSSAFSSSLGTSSSSSAVDPAKTIMIERVMDISREPVVWG